MIKPSNDLPTLKNFVNKKNEKEIEKNAYNKLFPEFSESDKKNKKKEIFDRKIFNQKNKKINKKIKKKI